MHTKCTFVVLSVADIFGYFCPALLMAEQPPAARFFMVHRFFSFKQLANAGIP